ncbi:hypothetical protein BRD15_04675 [Halobacteriales archaeon SW_6_65_15]|nr:MAG: hypothetical protein BRD15_04675 [Halobacteriales archaeon SW_6_65_15]
MPSRARSVGSETASGSNGSAWAAASEKVGSASDVDEPDLLGEVARVRSPVLKPRVRAVRVRENQ